MIRRSPSEYYIKYLLIHPDNFDDEDIIRILREHQLDYPGGDYLDRVRRGIRTPRVFRPLNELHTASFNFLVRHKVHKLFFPDRETKAALEILHKPRAKETVESMTMLGEPFALVAYRVRAMGLGEFTVKDVQRYCHFFWNVDLVDGMELAGLITKRVDDMAADGDTKTDLLAFKAMKVAQFQDPRHIAATSSVPLVAAMRLQIRAGVMPDRVATAKLAGMASLMGVGCAVEAAVNKGPRSAQDFANYAVGAKAMKELQELLGSPDEDVMKDLQQLTVQADGVPVPSIDELTEGDFTEGSVLLTEGKNVERK